MKIGDVFWLPGAIGMLAIQEFSRAEGALEKASCVGVALALAPFVAANCAYVAACAVVGKARDAVGRT